MSRSIASTGLACSRCSDALRDAWATSGDAVPVEITFDDEEIESSDVVKRFVSYVDGRPVSLPESKDLAKVDALLSFTDKWGCMTVQRHSLADLHRSVLLGKCHSTKSLFRLASKYDNIELAKSVISRVHTICKPRPQWRALQKEVAGRDSLDLRTWEIGELSDISPEYRWALDRATLGIDWSAKDTDWQRIAKRFEDFLELVRVP